MFPLMVRKGLGRGRGFRHYYTPESVKELESIIYWRERGVRNFEDLRWHLWLYSGWDRLWSDVRKDLLDMFPGRVDLSKVEKDEAGSILFDVFFEGRHRLTNIRREAFAKTRNLWLVTLPWLVTVFVTPKIDFQDRGSRPTILESPPAEEIDRIFGDRTYSLIESTMAANLFHLAVWTETLKDADEVQANMIKPKLRELEKAFEKEEGLRTLKKILGVRPLRKFGLQRLYRLVGVCTLLLVEEKGVLT